MTAPAIITAAPTISWIGADADPSDEFLDAMVALLAHVVEKRAAATADVGGDEQQGGNRA